MDHSNINYDCLVFTRDRIALPPTVVAIDTL